ncbi:glycoside hydrolase family 25 protein [Streptomyces sp. CBMA152]|uniref:glycoside hydrolase family 25 protein n=1 Tax=Streptomyces sp. CBMA152 TaxID=1896312 RepID=UPI00166183DB|nr:glycoside hydrolase family 25 protein [Streptomyces sp. CBMA152]MBD0743610.1 hypothetical protein [Streptomyces sp. CBMA152]
MGTYGQDWASYQSATPDTSGLSFAFVKITEGLSYINPVWITQRDHAKAAGLVWGGYHYPHMANSPQDEADFFLSQVNWQHGDVIVLDWEGYDNANQNVSKAAQAAYKDAWLRHVKSRMPYNPVGMYANTDYWHNVDTSNFYGDFLWIATAGRPAGDPGIQAPWLFHQYSESGGLDHDYCHLDSNALRSWALQSSEAEMPLTPADVKAVWAYSNGDHPDVHQTLADAAGATAAVKALAGKVDALATEVAALSAQGGLTAEEITAAAQAGAQAALAELGNALAHPHA